MLVIILMIVMVLLDMIMMIEMMPLMVQIVVVLDIARRGRGGFRFSLTHSCTTASNPNPLRPFADLLFLSSFTIDFTQTL